MTPSNMSKSEKSRKAPSQNSTYQAQKNIDKTQEASTEQKGSRPTKRTDVDSKVSSMRKALVSNNANRALSRQKSDLLSRLRQCTSQAQIDLLLIEAYQISSASGRTDATFLTNVARIADRKSDGINKTLQEEISRDNSSVPNNEDSSDQRQDASLAITSSNSESKKTLIDLPKSIENENYSEAEHKSLSLYLKNGKETSLTDIRLKYLAALKLAMQEEISMANAPDDMPQEERYKYRRECDRLNIVRLEKLKSSRKIEIEPHVIFSDMEEYYRRKAERLTSHINPIVKISSINKLEQKERLKKYITKIKRIRKRIKNTWRAQYMVRSIKSANHTLHKDKIVPTYTPKPNAKFLARQKIKNKYMSYEK
ncbi:MAG: hypothetical protein SFT93_01335 [Rickettsiaceae bacterium]|nr:hypothetical protein [Rickettsiaceae bacterium]